MFFFHFFQAFVFSFSFFNFFLLFLAMSSSFYAACIFFEKTIFSFKESTVVKISTIYNSKSPSLYLVKFCRKFVFDKYLKNSVLIFFINSFYPWSNGKTIKTPGFYYNTHLYISSICLKLDVVFINSNSVSADWTM